MVVRNARSLSLALAVSAMALSVACSRNNGGKEAAPAAPPSPTAPTGQQIPTEVDGASSTSSQEPGSPTQAPGDKPIADAGTIHYDPTGMTPEQILDASQAQGPTLVGPRADITDFAGQDLLYSGSGQDNLREILEAHVNSRSENQKAFDGDLARRVLQADVQVDWSSRTMTVSTVIMRAGRQVSYSTRASLDNSLTMKTKAPRVAGEVGFEAVCMDSQGGCKTVYVKIQEKSNAGLRTAHVLARKTDSTLFTEGNGFGINQNAEYERLLEILWNTAIKPTAVRKVEQIELQTSETIGGASNFVVKMLARTSSFGSEWVMVRGPLVKPASTPQMDLMIDNVGRGSISDSIRETRLKSNDGRGNLIVTLTIRKLTPEAQEDTFTLTFGRKHAPTRELRLL